MRYMDYFNTTQVSGDELTRYRDIARSQHEFVMEIFHAIPRPASPSEVHHIYCANLNSEEKAAPVTSIRRAISALTKKGLLRKTGWRVAGPYGRPEHTWELNRE